MEYGKDVQPDVFRRIGNDADHQSHAVLVTQFHHLADLCRASGVHGFQPAQVHQQVEAGRQIGQQRRHLFQSALEVLGPHLLDETNEEQPFRFVRHGQKHGHNLNLRGPEFDENTSKNALTHVRRYDVSRRAGGRSLQAGALPVLTWDRLPACRQLFRVRQDA